MKSKPLTKHKLTYLTAEIIEMPFDLEGDSGYIPLVAEYPGATLRIEFHILPGTWPRPGADFHRIKNGERAAELYQEYGYYLRVRHKDVIKDLAKPMRDGIPAKDPLPFGWATFYMLFTMLPMEQALSVCDKINSIATKKMTISTLGVEGERFYQLNHKWFDLQKFWDILDSGNFPEMIASLFRDMLSGIEQGDPGNGSEIGGSGGGSQEA